MNSWQLGWSDMDDLKAQATQAQERYEDHLSELRQLVDEADKLRSEFFHVLQNALRRLEGRLRIRTGKPSSSYKSRYEDYWQAFVLFRERLAQTFGLFHHEHIMPIPFNRTPNEEELEEWIDEIEDVIQSYRLHRHQQEDLLALIDLLDSIERLRRLKIPKYRGDASKPFYRSLTEAKSDVKQIEQGILRTLTGIEVVKINLQLGDYPPPETTRIVGRREDAEGDTVVIAEITLSGYLWKTKLLRKADVIVTAQEENT